MNHDIAMSVLMPHQRPMIERSRRIVRHVDQYRSESYVRDYGGDAASGDVR
jgi:hypothetical protein